MRAIITQRVFYYEPYGELWECLDSALQEFLLTCDCEAMGVSFTQEAYIESLFAHSDMLILSGGNDIGAYPKRDEFEKALVSYALSHHKKILAICRGMQLLAQYFGIALHKSSHIIGVAHTLQGTLCHNVHSYHQFCIKDAPKDYAVLAYVGDEIEAFANNQVLALMWHPEREKETASITADTALIRAFCKGEDLQGKIKGDINV